MFGVVLIATIAIFGGGVFFGAIVTVSRGIHRERQRYEEARRYRQEYGIWDGSESPDYFISSEAPDGVSLVARSFNGLHVRRPTVPRNDPELATLA
jgi:hypothetical protein